jgi:hypothetical protein
MRRGCVIDRGVIAAALAAAFGICAGSAEAATQSMVGSLGVVNPSVAPPRLFETGPVVLGKRFGPYAPDRGWTTVQVAGTTVGTSVGRTVTLGARKMDFSGVQLRDFPAFPSVGNQTMAYSSIQEQATFAEEGGALADCPGPGCTSSGSGTAISWCPPLAQPATPAPGTAANPVGNWDCASWPAGAGGGDRFLRIGVSNVSGRSHFGGALSLLRNVRSNSWRVLVQPGTDGIAEVSRSWMAFDDLAWTGGRPNFQYTTAPGNPGPRLLANLNANGAVTATLGCVNPTGTPGGSFMQGSPIVGAGSNCGTPVTPATPQQGWGFRMTTGDIEGSDPFPFGLVITTAAAPATPFAPNVGSQPGSAGFFFTRMGTDRVTTGGGQRNLVLLGGGVAVDPASGNAFFRIMDLRMDIVVPEPALGMGLVVGAIGLVGLSRRRTG